MKCPWYISAQAVRDYIELERMGDPGDEAVFARAEVALMTIAEQTVNSNRKVSPQRSGALRYRGPGPQRYSLYVREDERPEGDLPQLVRVDRGGRR